MNARQILIVSFGITASGALLWLKQIKSLRAALYNGDNILHLSNVPLTTQVTAVIVVTMIVAFCVRDNKTRLYKILPGDHTGMCDGPSLVLTGWLPDNSSTKADRGNNLV